jgi:tryptophan halogenase
MKQGIKQIAIIGSGAALNMTVAILAAALKPFKVKIVVLALPCSKAETLVETTGPEFSALCQILGLDEREVIRQCQATFRLGTHYTLGSEDMFVPYAHMGVKAEQDDFEQGLFQLLAKQAHGNLTRWSAAASAAVAGKFAIAGKDRPDLRQSLDYGVHLDLADYAKQLSQLGAADLIEWHHLSGQTVNIQHDETGNIVLASVDQLNVNADFWFDLRSGQSTPQWQDWAACLPISHSAQWRTQQLKYQQACTHMHKLLGGWLKIIPLRNGTVFQLFACDQHSDLAQLEQQTKELGYEINQSLNWVPVSCGTLENPWQGNCLYLGKAAIELGDLVFSELQCLQTALVQFIDLFPDMPIGEHNRRHYNQKWQHFTQDARDFSAAHFLSETAKYNGVSASLPDSLVTRLQVFERLGRLEPMHSDAVSESQWYHLLFGLGLRPQLCSVVLSTMDEPFLAKAAEQVAQSIATLVAGMPPHSLYMERFYPLPENQ